MVELRLDAPVLLAKSRIRTVRMLLDRLVFDRSALWQLLDARVAGVALTTLANLV